MNNDRPNSGFATRSRSFDTQSLAQAFACALKGYKKDCQKKSNTITSSSLSKLA